MRHCNTMFCTVGRVDCARKSFPARRFTVRGGRAVLCDHTCVQALRAGEGDVGTHTRHARTFAAINGCTQCKYRCALPLWHTHTLKISPRYKNEFHTYYHASVDRCAERVVCEEKCSDALTLNLNPRLCTAVSMNDGRENEQSHERMSSLCGDVRALAHNICLIVISV